MNDEKQPTVASPIEPVVSDDLYGIAKECFEDMIDEDTLCEMKYQKMIACVDGFKLGGIAMIMQAMEDAINKSR